MRSDFSFNTTILLLIVTVCRNPTQTFRHKSHEQQGQQYVCVFYFHSFWTSSSLDVPAGVTQESHT